MGRTDVESDRLGELESLDRRVKSTRRVEPVNVLGGVHLRRATKPGGELEARRKRRAGLGEG